MYNFVLVLHVIVVIALIGMILIQRGRSGGLVEALGGVESIFGTKTSAFLVKLTVVIAVCFFLTSISLAYLSKQKGKSLMDNYGDSQEQQASLDPIAKIQPQDQAEINTKIQTQASSIPQDEKK